MQSAIDDALSNRLKPTASAAMHGVPHSTLKDRLSGWVMHGTKSGPQPYLTATEEEELAGHLIEAANMGYGKTCQEVLSTVDRHVEQKEDVSLRTDRVSQGWWEKFLKRNPSLSLRSGDSTVGVKMDAINDDNIVPLINKLKFSRMLSSAHTQSDVQQHAKQCTSRSVSMYEHTRAYSSCTEDTRVVYNGTRVTEPMYCVRASLADTRVASITVYTHVRGLQLRIQY